MTYLALARQWRPRSFDALLGQEIIKQALSNALSQQRLHHAYLFTGTRGVGKTSIARLFAKALNCEQGISPTPCLKCEACLAIEQGRFTDLLEIDGASKTKVEDTRELLENVQYAPAHGRFKIYLIDEVHMLSQHSFNALLKTLEEPPSHVKFLLATTDPQKLPVTILSRCLPFHLRPLTPELIITQLQTILEHESFKAEPEALALIANAAQGSMRDALSLFEQTLACMTENTITAQSVKAVLGYTSQDYAIHILSALKTSPDTLFEISRNIAKEGGQYTYVLETLLHHLHQLALLQHLSSQSPLATPLSALRALKDAFSPETLQLFYEITLKGLHDLKRVPSLFIGFEMTLLRLLAFQPDTFSQPTEDVTTAQTPATPQAIPVTPTETAPLIQSAPQPSASSHSQQLGFRQGKPEEAPEVNKTVHEKTERAEGVYKQYMTDGERSCNNAENSSAKRISWSALIQTMALTGPTRNAAEQAELLALGDNECTLNIAETHRSLFTPNMLKRLEAALSTHFQKPMKITLTTSTTPQSPAQLKQDSLKLAKKTAKKVLQDDPLFHTLKTQFQAEVLPETIELIENDI